jgi:hypothetical protein
VTASELQAALPRRDIRLAVSPSGNLAYDAPFGAMTSDLVALIKAHKAVLLTWLTEQQPATETAHSDRETRRFLKVAVRWPDGRGWYDPAEASVAAAVSGLVPDQDALPDEPRPPGPAPTLYPRPDGGWETFTERAERYRQECGGLPPGASRRELAN